MKVRILYYIFLFFVPLITTGQNLTQYVNPFIGTGGHGHTYPGATAPFGLVQVSPDTRLEGWDGCGGYHYDDTVIYGLSHTHLQGTGVSDYGDILMIPTNYNIRKADVWRDAYKSHFKHISEKAEPGYYKVTLDDYNIQVELTATERTAFHRYTLSPGDSCRLFIDMMHRDNLLYYDIQTHGDTAISGYRVSKAWATEQHCYFYAVFNHPFKDLAQLDVSYQEKGKEGNVRTVIEQVQVFSLAFGPYSSIEMKIGISGTDVEGARKNLYAEVGNKTFDEIRTSSRSAWNKKLAKLPCPLKEKTEIENYYTALYHCYTVPNIWSDVDGRYRGMDHKIHKAEGYTRYTVFSLWDTFRAYHPLMARLEPEVTRDWVVTFLEMYKERGELPVWELAANETYCMIGYHSVPVITEAYASGIRNFDTTLALEAMVAAARGPQSEKHAYETLGYVPGDKFSESVSKTLEFAYDDWCVAEFAGMTENFEVEEVFRRRCQNWKNLFDPETHFMRPRRNGGFPEPFDPHQVDFNYTEANAWQYSLFVPHDMQTLIEYHGGNRKMKAFLNDMFSADTKTTGREQSDITGLIGQYAHGNEPSHHAAFIYAWMGNKKLTQKWVKKIMSELYNNTSDGLCGNEDCGQMSAWYVLAAHGVYSFLPGSGKFLQFGKGHTLFPTVKDFPKFNYKRSTPRPIVSGPQLPYHEWTELTFKCIKGEGPYDVQMVQLKPEKKILEKFALSDGQVLKRKIHDDVVVEFTCAGQEMGQAVFRKMKGDIKLVSVTEYNNPYNGGGRDALVDGVRGGDDFRTGSWQGWQGKTVETVLDLGAVKSITSISVSVLQEAKSWIWFPAKMEVLVSDDGNKFTPAGYVLNEKPLDTKESQTNEMTKTMRGQGRYVKIILYQAFEKIPDWHLGAGGKPWIFADEIIIR